MSSMQEDNTPMEKKTTKRKTSSKPKMPRKKRATTGKKSKKKVASKKKAPSKPKMSKLQESISKLTPGQKSATGQIVDMFNLGTVKPRTVKKFAKKTMDKLNGTTPKRTVSAYQYFAQAMRPTIQEDNENASFGEMGKLIGEAWKKIDKREKKIYEDMVIKKEKKKKEKKTAKKKTGKKAKKSEVEMLA